MLELIVGTFCPSGGTLESERIFLDMRTNNRFVQAVGIAAIAGMAFLAISWSLGALSRILQTVVYFVKFVLLPYSWQAALALGALYLLFAAVTSSRNA